MTFPSRVLPHTHTEPLSGGDAVNADLDAELVLPEELHLPLLSRPTRQAGFGGALGAGFLVGQEAEGLKDNGILAAEFPMSPAHRIPWDKTMGQFPRTLPNTSH